MPSDRTPWAALVVALLATLAIFSLRVGTQPLQPYGSNAAEYIEHAVRLEVADLARDRPTLGSFLFAADETVLTHPPGLHVATLPAHALLGRSAEAIVWTGLGWHLLLALALGACAGALSGRRDAAAAATIAGLLFPAGVAAATRYHYDLPMTALIWSGAAVLLAGRDRAPLRSGLGGGVVLAAASFVKWTALPLGLVVATAALWPKNRIELRRRWPAVVGLGAAWATPVGAFLSLSASSFLAGVMAVEGEPSAQPAGPLAVPVAFLSRVARSLLETSPGSAGWYPLATCVALFSPLLCVASWPLLRGWWRSGEDRALVLIAVGGQWAVLTLGLSVLDERFGLTAAPALLLAAALGWTRLPRRGAIGAGTMVVALLVSLEFHSTAAWPASGSTTVPMGARAPALTARGPWLGDSFERRGWSSGSTTPTSSPQARARLIEALDRCRVEQLGYVDGLSDQGDTWWLRYRARLGGYDRLVLSHGALGPRRFWWPDPDTDAASHRYERIGFSLDAVAEPGLFSGMSELELGLNLRALGLDVAALDHFGPTVALTRVPPGPHSPLDGAWRELERIEGHDAEPLALYGRGHNPCPGPAFEPAPRR